jgi:23S rRNA pseudouridine2605 synthase
MTKKTNAPTKAKKTNKLQPESTEPKLEATPEVQDPIGDATDGEARATLEPQTASETESAIEAEPELQADAEDGTESDEVDSEPGFNPKPRPPSKLDRLQKILAQAGVASRRKAEELIEQGRVQVNGKVVTELGTKADAARDHIRVDGKLLQGAERLRYFVLNKPRGFVTTVKDPEDRPTVMQFFDKMRERLYPVGRLDYMSEGLLLVTNDGELANRLTRAAAGVEKTYLVKVAGQPTEAELDILRAGVAIERGKLGSDRVRTSPARIRQVRQGDNPWYEVVLIEGRNRELRKMFEEIDHFVEKIRRVGYGPLILDQEPGNLRELDTQELELLRKAADGTLRTPKSKEIRRRNLIDSLPPEKPAFRPRAAKPYSEGSKDYRPKRSFAQSSGSDRPSRPTRAGGDNLRSIRPAGKDFDPPRPVWKKDDRSARPLSRFAAGSTGESHPPAAKPHAAKPYRDRPAPARHYGARPATGSTYRDNPHTNRPYAGKPAAGRTFGPKPPAARSVGDKPAAGKTYGARPSFNKPAFGRLAPGKPVWSKPGASDRPPLNRPASAPRRESPVRDEDSGPVRPPNLHIEEIHGSERPTPSRPSASRPFSPRPSSARPSSNRPPFDRRSRSSAPGSDAAYSRPTSARSNSGPTRSTSAKPFRGEGGLARPFTTSSGKLRAGGARPSSKPGKPSTRSFGSGTAKRPFRRDEGQGSSARHPARPYTPRQEGASGFRPSKAKSYSNSDSRAERKAGLSWKPKPSFGAPGKPASGSHSKPRPGGSSGGKKRS